MSAGPEVLQLSPPSGPILENGNGSAPHHDEPRESSTPSTPSGRKTSVSFAPLPKAEKLQRRNSITLGVAARSQILRSQGAGRGPRPPGVPRPPPKTVHVYEGGQDWNKRDQVVDIGEVGKRLWKKWRSGGKSESSESSKGKSMTTDEAAEKESKEAKAAKKEGVVEEDEIEIEEDGELKRPEMDHRRTASPLPTRYSPPPEIDEEDEVEGRPIQRRGSAPALNAIGRSRERDTLGFDWNEDEDEDDIDEQSKES